MAIVSLVLQTLHPTFYQYTKIALIALQSNLSYILLFFTLLVFSKRVFSRYKKKRKELSLSSIRFDSLKPIQTKTIPKKKKDSLFAKKIDTMGLDSIKPKESIQEYHHS